MNVLVAIPVFNEAPYLRRVLARVREYVRDVLVVDDGSTDATPRLLAEWPNIFRLRHPTNLGYGQSLIDAFDFAGRGGYEWLMTMDCDEQHEPEHLPEFLAAAREGRGDVISGSRYLVELPGNGQAPAERRRINACITAVLNELLGLQLTDAFCGFKAYRVSALRGLRLTEPGYAFPLQFWVQAAGKHLRIVELPVRRIYNDHRRSFGAALDDPRARLGHYLRVLASTLEDHPCPAGMPNQPTHETSITLTRSCRCP